MKPLRLVVFRRRAKYRFPLDSVIVLSYAIANEARA